MAVVALAACTDKTHPGFEYAPNMYRSVPLDPLTQSVEQDYKYNQHNMTMREPVEGTVARGQMPYPFTIDQLEEAALMANPIKKTPEVVAEGEALYGRFCQHCHGAEGDGKGLVGDKYTGVANLKSRAHKDKSMGHLFHVMTYGKARMNSHASQLNQEERWKIAHYVKELQAQ